LNGASAQHLLWCLPHHIPFADGSRIEAPDGGREGRPGRHAAIEESATGEYKEEGNQFIEMGHKHFTFKESAAREYTKAITQMCALSLLNPDSSVLLANRTHINLT
jgi:hypothetical protein